MNLGFKFLIILNIYVNINPLVIRFVNNKIDNIVDDKFVKEKLNNYLKSNVEENNGENIKKPFFLLNGTYLSNKLDVELFINNNTITDIAPIGNSKRIKLNVEFNDNDNPVYNVEIINYGNIIKKGMKSVTQNKLTDFNECKNIFINVLNLKNNISKKYDASNMNKDTEDIFKKMFSEEGLKEIENKWILFLINFKDDNSDYYFYCNDIENSDIKEISGIFNSGYIEKIKVVNSNISDVKSLQYMFNNLKYVKEIDLSNLFTTNPINLFMTFNGCNTLEEIKFPKENKLKLNDLKQVFFMCNNLKTVNFEDIILDDDLILSNHTICAHIMPYPLIYGCNNIEHFKFPKFNESNNKTQKKILFSIRGKIKNLDLSNLNKNNLILPLIGSNLEIGNLILPDGENKFTENEIELIYENYPKIKRCQIGNININFENDANIKDFMKNPDSYVKNRDKIKNNYNMNKNGNENSTKNTTKGGFNHCCNCCGNSCR